MIITRSNTIVINCMLQPSNLRLFILFTTSSFSSSFFFLFKPTDFLWKKMRSKWVSICIMGVFGANNAAAEGRSTLNYTVCQCQCTHTHLCVFITIIFESKPYHFQSTSLNSQDCKQSSKQSNNMAFCGRQTKVHISSWTNLFFHEYKQLILESIRI